MFDPLKPVHDHLHRLIDQGERQIADAVAKALGREGESRATERLAKDLADRADILCPHCHDQMTWREERFDGETDRESGWRRGHRCNNCGAAGPGHFISDAHFWEDQMGSKLRICPVCRSEVDYVPADRNLDGGYEPAIYACDCGWQHADDPDREPPERAWEL